MDLIEAENLVRKLEKMVESEGVDHHSVTKERRGNQQYIEMKISIKIK